MRHVLICYYSSTGNTKLACQYIGNHLVDTKVDFFNITQKETPDFSHYDLIGFATFTDWGDPPLFVKLFIDKLPVQTSKPAFLFNTCAGLSGKTLKTLNTWVNQKGFKVVAGFTLRAPESYPPAIVRGITREKNPLPRDLKRLNRFIQELNGRLKSSNFENLPEIKVKIGLIDTFSPRFQRNRSKLKMGNKYVDQSLCTQCGTCEKGCPYEAIQLSDTVSFNESKCGGCWSCFNHCPQKAIYTENVKGIGQYDSPPEYRNKLMG